MSSTRKTAPPPMPPTNLLSSMTCTAPPHGKPSQTSSRCTACVRTQIGTSTWNLWTRRLLCVPTRASAEEGPWKRNVSVPWHRMQQCHVGGISEGLMQSLPCAACGRRGSSGWMHTFATGIDFLMDVLLFSTGSHFADIFQCDPAGHFFNVTLRVISLTFFNVTPRVISLTFFNVTLRVIFST